MVSTNQLSKQALRRMPYYLRELKQLKREGAEIVTAPAMAALLCRNEVQVRKDFAAVCSTRGKPKTGFSIDDLIAGMEALLGYRVVKNAVLVGAGRLGRALISYDTFHDYGLNIAAAFDLDPRVIGSEIDGKPVLHMDELTRVAAELEARIGIITCPAGAAQEACDRLVESGILAIWNFAPAHLTVPGNILVQSENMAASLAVLSMHLQEKLEQGG